MASKTLADWLDSSSDEDSPPRPAAKRRGSNAHAVFDSHHKSHNSSRTRSPNAPSFSADSPIGAGASGRGERDHHLRRSSSRASIRRSSSRGSLIGGPIRSFGGISPTEPPLPQIDVAKAKRQQEADERRRKMEEMKAKLRETLGDAAADKIAGGPKDGGGSGAAKSALHQSDDEFPSITGGSASNALPSHLPPLSARSSVDFNRKASLNHSHGHGHAYGHHGATPPLHGYGYGHGHNGQLTTPPRHVVVETEVMLADRGTQTACEVEVQTDPDPLVASCPQCYTETYGHAHHNFFNCGHSSSPAAMGAAMAAMAGGGGAHFGDPVFAKLLGNRLGAMGGMGMGMGMGHQHGSPMSMSSPHSPQFPSYPSYSPAAAVGPSDQWSEQLKFIEGSIDQLIRRYNLPPPPGMEQYRPAGMF